MNMHVASNMMRTNSRNFIGRTHKLLIDGRWVEAKSGKTFPVIDPSTGLDIARVAQAEAEDVNAAVAAARRAFDTGPWSRMTPVERGKLVWRLGDILEEHADELAELEAIDNGKPVSDARAVDVAFSHELLRYMGGWSTKLTGSSVNISAPGDWHGYTLREPVGVVGQIIPWNFPLLMAVFKIAPALAAGCTVVLKPAEQTPLSALRLGELIQLAGFPAGVVNIVTGYGAAGAALAEHPDVDKVAFTGSNEVGKLIIKAAAGNFKKVSLELGGKSPAVVFPDADLDIAIPGIASAGFFNMGQVCTAGTRVFVHEKIYDKVMAGLASEAQKLRVGPGLDPDTQMGPLVSEEQLKRVSGFIEAGREQGAEFVTGGKRIGSEGYFIEPTVLAQTRPDMTVVKEEIFGPVVCAIPFKDDNLDAIAAKANDTRFGLSASIWTRDLKTAHTMARKLKAGIIQINIHNFIDVAMPFGGYKQSGWGRELGHEVLELYTETKAITTRL